MEIRRRQEVWVTVSAISASFIRCLLRCHLCQHACAGCSLAGLWSSHTGATQPAFSLRAAGSPKLCSPLPSCTLGILGASSFWLLTLCSQWRQVITVFFKFRDTKFFRDRQGVMSPLVRLVKAVDHLRKNLLSCTLDCFITFGCIVWLWDLSSLNSTRG